MPGYIQTTCIKFQHNMPLHSVDSPHKHTPIFYGAQKQLTVTDTSKNPNEEEIKQVQNIVGTLIYYSRCVDSNLAADLSSIALEQANGMEEKMQACKQLLDYVACCDNTALWLMASDMILSVHSNASYLSEKKARS